MLLPSPGVPIAMQFVSGLAVRSASVTVPLFIGEAPPAMHGTLRSWSKGWRHDITYTRMTDNPSSST